MCQRIQSNFAVVLFMVASFLLCILSLVSCRSYNNGLIFYDIKTLRPYLPPTVSVSRGRGLANFKFSDKGSIWSTFGKPCECSKNLCGCCAGIKVKQYNFDQKMCANVTFVPPKEEALLEVYLNEKPSSKYGISVRNPSPFCIPVMMGIPMAMCVQMSDIAIKGNNLNMCMDFIVRLATTDLFEMHFQCMQMGLDGFQYIDKDGNPVIPPGSSKNEATTNEDDDYYDYEADENEISYGIASEPTDSEKKKQKEQTNGQQQQYQYQITNSQNAINAANDAFNAPNLQQQMHELQNAQQYDIDKNNFLTQIYDEESTLTAMTMPAPIVFDEAENEPDLIEAITTAYDTETDTTAEEESDKDESSSSKTSITAQDIATETIQMNEMEPTTATIIALSPVNDAPSKNYNDELSTTTALAGLSTTTTITPVSKPIVAPLNLASYIYDDAAATNDSTMTSENIYAGNKTKTANIEAISASLESLTNNNYAASHTPIALNDISSDDYIDFEPTTVVAYEDDTATAFIAAPDTITAAGTGTNTTTIKATIQENIARPIAAPSNAYSSSSDTKQATTTEEFKALTTSTTASPPVILVVDNNKTIVADASSNNVEPATLQEVITLNPSYWRRFFA